MRIVIIEDEPLTADDLADTLLQIEPTIQIEALLPSVKKAIAYLQEKKLPDLIFSDIQLGDGLSFEIFKTVAITTPVVFCTAYNEYALDAFRANGIDYVLKPFTTATIANTVQKYKRLQQNTVSENNTYTGLYELLENRLFPKRSSVLVYLRDKIIPLPIPDIAVCYSQNLITHVATFDQKNYTVNHTLEELETMCGPQFFRANRQFLINHKSVKDASQYFGRKLAVTLTIPFTEDIIISKAKSPAFLSWLASL